MIEQRIIINHKLCYIQFHQGHLSKREEYITKPVEYKGVYFASIPNFEPYMPIIVKKGTEIKTVYFSSKR